ncbi:hypothetical protein P692DRAFT_20315618 [Suillus brevipes Sb2]|nr:hypothetical protein P692DRAFT_20315618 [Suillus brevipes Sb2]
MYLLVQCGLTHSDSMALATVVHYFCIQTSETPAVSPCVVGPCDGNSGHPIWPGSALIPGNHFRARDSSSLSGLVG